MAVLLLVVVLSVGEVFVLCVGGGVIVCFAVYETS
jgi:hypothetical protein